VIELSERDGVALLRLADGKANAMSLDFCEALTARFAALSSARAVVLTEPERYFPQASTSCACSRVARLTSANSCPL